MMACTQQVLLMEVSSKATLLQWVPGATPTETAIHHSRLETAMHRPRATGIDTPTVPVAQAETVVQNLATDIQNLATDMLDLATDMQDLAIGVHHDATRSTIDTTNTTDTIDIMVDIAECFTLTTTTT
jgi:hypothetical protein